MFYSDGEEMRLVPPGMFYLIRYTQRADHNPAKVWGNPPRPNQPMTPKLLKAFLAVAQTGNMSQAAVQLNLAQSSVSDQIQTLENELGAMLFDRAKGGITLTAAGRTFKPYAEAILATIDEATAALQEGIEQQRTTLVIGALETIATQWLPARHAQFQKMYPAIGITLRVANTGELIRAVSDGSVDAAFCFESPDLDPALVRRAVAEVPLVMIAAPGVGAGVSAGPAPGFVTTRKGCIFRRIFDDNIAALDQHNAGIVAQVDSIGAIVNFVARGSGVALVPRMAAATALQRGEVEEVELKQPGLCAVLSLVWKRRRIQPASLRRLLDSLGSD